MIDIVSVLLITMALFFWTIAIVCFRTAIKVFYADAEDYEYLRQKAIRGEYITDEELKEVYKL